MKDSFKVVILKDDGTFSTRSCKEVVIIDKENDHKFMLKKNKTGSVNMRILPYGGKLDDGMLQEE